LKYNLAEEAKAKISIRFVKKSGYFFHEIKTIDADLLMTIFFWLIS